MPGIIALLGDLIVAIIAGFTLWATLVAIFDPKGLPKVQNLLSNWVGAGIGATGPLLTAFESQLAGVMAAFVTAFQSNGKSIGAPVNTAVSGVASGILTAAASALNPSAVSTPGNAATNAAAAMGNAFGFGISSAAVTASFEALLPEKLNTLNGVGPMLSEMAGFREVASSVLDPLYKNAFGKSLDYLYKSIYQPDYPDESDATIWYARGLLSQKDLEEVFTYSGLKAKYESAYLASAYRPLSPFIVARAAQTGVFSNADLTDMMTFAGYRAIDQTRMQTAFAALTAEPYIHSALAALKSAAEQGLYTGTSLTDELNALGIPAAVQYLITKEIGYKSLERITTDFIKSNNEGYKYGTVSDADYVINLENAGIATALADALYAVASIAKTGKAANAAAVAATRLANRQTKAQVQAASEQYLTGTTDVIALTAQLALSGLDPLVQSYLIQYLTAKYQASLRYAYGITGTTAQIQLLREKVTAIQQQVQKAGLTGNAALSTLASLGISGDIAQALVSAWLAYGQATVAPI